MQKNDTSPDKHTKITDESVIAGALERVTNSLEFKDSKRSTQMLNYIVEKYLSGHANQINGTTIAQDVLGASIDFDPSTNPIVRVQAGRLRKLLSEYYRRSGKDDHVIIYVAKGQYAPQFERRNPLPITNSPQNKSKFSPRKITKWFLTCLIGVTILASLIYGLRNTLTPQTAQTTTIYPSIVILPFHNLTGYPKYDVLGQGFQHQLGTDLSKFRVVRVVFSSQTYEEILATTNPNADYVLEGTFLSVENEIDLLIKLRNVKSGKTITQHRIKEKSGDDSYFNALANISANLSMQYAGRIGVIAKDSLANLKQEMETSNKTSLNLKAFECLSLFYRFEEDKTLENFNHAAPCLEHQVSQNGADSSLYAALAWITVYASPRTELFKNIPNPEKYSLQRALELAEQAIAIDPSNSIAHNYVALIQWRLGHPNAAIMSIRRSIQLNPADASNLSNLAQFLCYTGDWENGLEASREAIRLNPNAQYWYYTPLFARAVLDRDGEKADLYAQKHFGVGGSDGATFALIAASINEDENKIEVLKPLVEKYAIEHGNDPLYITRRFLRSTMIIDAFAAELIAVGISIPEN